MRQRAHRLIDYLLDNSLAPDERTARGLIMRGDVLVDERPQTSPAFPLPEDCIVRIRGRVDQPVSRGYDKLGPVADGKYTLIEVEGDADDAETQEIEDKLRAADASRPKVKTSPRFAASTLPKATQEFIELIFNKNMFTRAMADFEIDTKKMPLVKLS